MHAFALARALGGARQRASAFVHVPECVSVAAADDDVDDDDDDDDDDDEMMMIMMKVVVMMMILTSPPPLVLPLGPLAAVANHNRH